MKNESPCIGLCELDETSMFCKGCYRSINEITDWKTFSEKKKEKILKLLKKRKR